MMKGRFNMIMTAMGLAMYLVLHEVATVQRGYEAIGGEIFFLLLPLWVWLGVLLMGDR